MGIYYCPRCGKKSITVSLDSRNFLATDDGVDSPHVFTDYKYTCSDCNWQFITRMPFGLDDYEHLNDLNGFELKD